MIAIKDVGMPKNCAECMVRQNCKVSDEWDEFDWYYGGRLDGCPLVEIEERKVGKWIRISGGCKCPFCDMAFSRLKEDCSDNFCPNCGAEMRGVENV